MNYNNIDINQMTPIEPAVIETTSKGRQYFTSVVITYEDWRGEQHAVTHDVGFHMTEAKAFKAGVAFANSKFN